MKLNLRNPLHFVMAMLMAFALAACGTMQKPVTAQDYIQSAKGQVTAAYKSIGDLKAGGSITGAEATMYITRVDAVNKQVSLAAMAVDKGADLSTAQGALTATLSALVAIQSELKAKGK